MLSFSYTIQHICTRTSDSDLSLMLLLWNIISGGVFFISTYPFLQLHFLLSWYSLAVFNRSFSWLSHLYATGIRRGCLPDYCQNPSLFYIPCVLFLEGNLLQLEVSAVWIFTPRLPWNIVGFMTHCQCFVNGLSMV